MDTSSIMSFHSTYELKALSLSLTDAASSVYTVTFTTTLANWPTIAASAKTFQLTVGECVVISDTWTHTPTIGDKAY